VWRHYIDPRAVSSFAISIQKAQGPAEYVTRFSLDDCAWQPGAASSCGEVTSMFRQDVCGCTTFVVKAVRWQERVSRGARQAAHRIPIHISLGALQLTTASTTRRILSRDPRGSDLVGHFSLYRPPFGDVVSIRMYWGCHALSQACPVKGTDREPSSREGAVLFPRSIAVGIS
jgi:hypothetical protein